MAEPPLESAGEAQPSLEDLLRNGKDASEEDRELLKNRLTKCTVKDLKVVAKNVGAKLTHAKTKGDIVERLLALSRVGSLAQSDFIAAAEWRGLSYLTDEVRKELEEVPQFQSISEGWSKSLARVEKFDFGNLFVYLVESRDGTFEKNGDVYSAQCNCVAGAGAACSNIAAFLFAIDDLIRKGATEFPTELTRTSQPCKWKQPPKKSVAAAAVSNIKFSSPAHGVEVKEKVAIESFDPRCESMRTLHGAFAQLTVDLQGCFPESGLFELWPESTRTPVAPVIEEEVLSLAKSMILLDYSIIEHWESADEIPPPSEAEIDRVMKAMTCDAETICAVEQSTRGQVESGLWHDLRVARLTSSRFGEIVKRKETTPPDNLLAGLMGYRKQKELGGVPSIKWGVKNEPKARDEYIKHMKSKGHDISWRHSGLNLHPAYAFIGASTDGKVADSLLDTNTLGCLEIKCPYSIDNSSLLELSPL